MAPIFVMFATNINETTHTLHAEPGINLVCDELFLWRSCFNVIHSRYTKKKVIPSIRDGVIIKGVSIVSLQCLTRKREERTTERQ